MLNPNRRQDLENFPDAPLAQQSPNSRSPTDITRNLSNSNPWGVRAKKSVRK